MLQFHCYVCNFTRVSFLGKLLIQLWNIAVDVSPLFLRFLSVNGRSEEQ